MSRLAALLADWTVRLHAGKATHWRTLSLAAPGGEDVLERRRIEDPIAPGFDLFDGRAVQTVAHGLREGAKASRQ
jgi:hypothetical protein